MRKVCEILLLIVLVSCNQETKKIVTNKRAPFTGVISETLMSDSMSVRAITLDKNKVWYGGDNSRFGFYDLDKKEKKSKKNLKNYLCPPWCKPAQVGDNLA